MGRYETPDYKVLLKEDQYELREYNDFYLIEYDAEEDPQLDNGFGTLFKYISSSNDKNEKINMTIPVLKEITDNGMKMAFVVPQEKWNDIPRPVDSRLKIKLFNKGEFAVISYTGAYSSKLEEKHVSLLEKWMQKKGFVSKSNFMIAIYNGPYVPFFLRRNEILVRVK